MHNTLSYPSCVIAVVNSVTGNDCQFDIRELNISDQDDTENAAGHAHASSMHSKYANADANAKTYPQSGTNVIGNHKHHVDRENIRRSYP